MQWHPPGGTLGKIVAEAHERAAALTPRSDTLMAQVEKTLTGPSLERALRAPTVGVIGEVKRSSPSKGVISADLDAAAQARAYAAGGAVAVSVLTEQAHFSGSTDDLVVVRGAVTIPVLKKDFHVAPIQLLEARALGASAALLIVRAIPPHELDEMMETARALSLELLVEVCDEEELGRALRAGATMIGINNRNLETLAIDPSVSERIMPLVPGGLVAIAESGIRSRADVLRYAACGADAVLVGSSLSSAGDPLSAMQSLAGVERCVRG